jgi:hypothetical protein
LELQDCDFKSAIVRDYEDNNGGSMMARSEVVWWTAACHQRKGVQVYPMTGASWNDHHGAIGAGNRQKWATYRKNKRFATGSRGDWQLEMVVVVVGVGIGVVCWAEARGEVAQKEGRSKKRGQVSVGAWKALENSAGPIQPR